MSQWLDKLEKAGLVTRHVDVDDRRLVDVELTAAGVELIDSMLARPGRGWGAGAAPLETAAGTHRYGESRRSARCMTVGLWFNSVLGHKINALTCGFTTYHDHVVVLAQVRAVGV